MAHRDILILFFSIVLGIISGIMFPEWMLYISWIGDVFINMLKLISLPLIFTTLVSAITSMYNIKKLGQVAGTTLKYVFSSVAIAVFIGLILTNLFHPGSSLDSSLIPNENGNADLQPLGFSAFIQGLFPASIFEAAAKFEVMPIVIFAIAFSIAYCISDSVEVKIVGNFFNGLKIIFMKIIAWIMFLTPIGLFSLLGATTARSVLSHQLTHQLMSLAYFLIVFVVALLLQIIWQAIFIKLLTRCSIKALIKTATPALITAFGTSSSIATLPITLTTTEKLQINPEISRFVLPFVSTINLAGTAMYEACAALFFAQILGIPLTILHELGIFLIAIVAGMGATGIPEAGLVTMVAVLRSVHIPITVISLLLPFDRILDRCRTFVNVWGDLACAICVNHFANRYQYKSFKLTKNESIKT